MAALERELREQFELPIRMRWQEKVREVIVARGSYAFGPPRALGSGVLVHPFPPRNRPIVFSLRGMGMLKGFLEYFLADATHTPVVCEVAGADEIFVEYWLNYDASAPPPLQTLLDELARQTGLTFTREQRPVTLLELTRDP